MSIQQQLSDDLKAAMRSRNDLAKSVIRLILAAIQNAEIEKRGTLDDEGVSEILARMSRQYRESISIYSDASRTDLAEKEEAELNILLGYLPDQLGEQEIIEIVRLVVDQVGATSPSDKGKVMGALMPKVRGRADGSLVNRIVSTFLESGSSA
jgi:uncharacterized protein YqeY